MYKRIKAVPAETVEVNFLEVEVNVDHLGLLKQIVKAMLSVLPLLRYRSRKIGA